MSRHVPSLWNPNGATFIAVTPFLVCNDVINIYSPPPSVSSGAHPLAITSPLAPIIVSLEMEMSVMFKHLLPTLCNNRLIAFNFTSSCNHHRRRTFLQFDSTSRWDYRQESLELDAGHTTRSESRSRHAVCRSPCGSAYVPHSRRYPDKEYSRLKGARTQGTYTQYFI